MSRIIVSGSRLLRTLQEFFQTERKENYVTIECKGKKLHFDDFETSIDVEAKFDWIAEVETRRLKSLVTFLKAISDQPIVITFKTNEWILIDNIYI